MDCRGNCAAWLSGPEKSRHFKHELVAEGFGLEACRAARFGREESGIGGGAPGASLGVSLGVSLGLFGGKGGGVSVDLFNPNDSADLLMGSGLGGSCFAEVCRVGRGGREGRTGGGWIVVGPFFDTTLGAEWDGFRVTLARFGSSFSLFGGRGGNFEGS
jgi:hypothetical protein